MPYVPRMDLGSRKHRITYRAEPISPDAKKAHPDGIVRQYTNVTNMIRFGLRNAHPGQYMIVDADTGKKITDAYVKAQPE